MLIAEASVGRRSFESSPASYDCGEDHVRGDVRLLRAPDVTRDQFARQLVQGGWRETFRDSKKVHVRGVADGQHVSAYVEDENDAVFVAMIIELDE